MTWVMIVGCAVAAWLVYMIGRMRCVCRYDESENLEHLDWLP